jgi:hypothetical protein
MAYTNDSSTSYHAVYVAVGNNLYWFNFFDANLNDDNTNINYYHKMNY